MRRANGGKPNPLSSKGDQHSCPHHPTPSVLRLPARHVPPAAPSSPLWGRSVSSRWPPWPPPRRPRRRPATTPATHAARARLPGRRSATCSRRSASPLDGAHAKVVFVQHEGRSTFVLLVSGVGAAGVGNTYGAHLHTGACVAGNGAAAGPHYNQSTVEGVVPPVVSDQTEVWLDVTVGADGSGVAVAKRAVRAGARQPRGRPPRRAHRRPRHRRSAPGLPAGELVMRTARYAAAGLPPRGRLGGRGPDLDAADLDRSGVQLVRDAAAPGDGRHRRPAGGLGRGRSGAGRKPLVAAGLPRVDRALPRRGDASAPGGR